MLDAAATQNAIEVKIKAKTKENNREITTHTIYGSVTANENDEK